MIKPLILPLPNNPREENIFSELHRHAENVRAESVDLDSTQTVTGAKTFSGAASFGSTVSIGGNVTLTGSGTSFEDLAVPLTMAMQGATSLPHFDYTNIGYLFPQNDPAEKLYFIVQMPHAWKQGTTIYPHVHWQQAADANVTWKMDYKWHNIGSAIPANWTTLNLATLVHTYESGTIHQLSKSTAGIAGTDMNISSIMQIILYRDDNTYTGDAMAFQFDIHYEKDGFGSNGEYTK